MVAWCWTAPNLGLPHTPAYELQQRAVAPVFETAAFKVCSRAAAPPNLQCGAGLIFLLAQGWESSEAATTWLARRLSTPGDYSFRGQDSCFFILVCLSRPCHRGCSLCFGHHRLHSAAESTGACTASFTKLAQRSVQLDASDKCALHAHALRRARRATTRAPYETPRSDAIDATPVHAQAPCSR